MHKEQAEHIYNEAMKLRPSIVTSVFLGKPKDPDQLIEEYEDLGYDAALLSYTIQTLMEDEILLFHTGDDSEPHHDPTFLALTTDKDKGITLSTLSAMEEAQSAAEEEE